MAKKLLPAKYAVEVIEKRIYVVRGQRVMLDEDLAEMYEVGTKVINQAMKRHPDRFPSDFAFQLTLQEFTDLRSQIVTSNASRGGRRYMPWVFTEQGVAMLSSVLSFAEGHQTQRRDYASLHSTSEVARHTGRTDRSTAAFVRDGSST